MKPTIKFDGMDQLQRRLGALGKQVPFAVSRALNATANAIQKAQQEQVAQAFTLRRRDFILRTVYRKPGEDFARKDWLLAAVRIDERRDVLAKFQTPGEKAPLSGRTLSIPQAVKRNKADIVTRGNRPKAFDLKPNGKAVTGNRRTFLLKKGGESFLLLQRTGPRRRRAAAAPTPQGRDPRLKVLYVFAKRTRIPKRLTFVETAQRVAAARMTEIFEAELLNAIRTAK